MSEGGPCETPLLDLLRNVPEDGRHMYEHHSTHHQNVPYGRLCKRAADEIEQQRKMLERCFNVLCTSPGIESEFVDELDKIVNPWAYSETTKNSCDCNNSDPTRCKNRLGGYKMIEQCKCECHELDKNCDSYAGLAEWFEPTDEKGNCLHWVGKIENGQVEATCKKCGEPIDLTDLKPMPEWLLQEKDNE